MTLETTDPHSVAALAQLAGDVSIVVNNAGICGGGPLLTANIEAMRALFDVNVGSLRVAQAFAPIFERNGPGALVDIDSALSWAAGAGGYGASKAALWSLTNSLRLDLAGQHTLVVGVHVGFVDTDLVRSFPGEKLAPVLVARATLDGVERGDTEVLVDDLSRRLKDALSGPVEGLAPQRR